MNLSSSCALWILAPIVTAQLSVLMSMESAMAAEPPTIRTHFNRPSAPGRQDNTLKIEIERLIDQTLEPGEMIRASIYMITFDSTVQALIRAYRRGVDVKLVLDDNWQSSSSAVEAANALTLALGPSRVIRCANGGCIKFSANNHNKFFTFSKTRNPSGTPISNVSVQTSFNLNNAQLSYYQDMVVIENDPDVYSHYVKYWSDLAKQREILNYQSLYGTTFSRYLPIKVYSSGNTSTDVMLEKLKSVTCRRRASRIDLSHSLFDGDRGDKFILELARLRDAGCEVHVLLPADVNDQVSFNLARSKRLDLSIIDAERDVLSHSKILLINADFEGVLGNKIVFAGSLNMTESSRMYNDDSFVAINDDAVYNSYLSQIEFIRERVLASAATPTFVDFPSATYSFRRYRSYVSTPVISAGLGPYSCTAYPALPQGLSFHPYSCSIIGAPLAISSRRDYTITVEPLRYRSYKPELITLSIEVLPLPTPNPTCPSCFVQ